MKIHTDSKGGVVKNHPGRRRDQPRVKTKVTKLSRRSKSRSKASQEHLPTRRKGKNHTQIQRGKNKVSE